jgi:tetratricopeptide (TPR) repeat protein
VAGSFVTGDLILVSGVGRDVRITTDRPPYRVGAFDALATPLSVQEAREQPSRLLLARYEVVPFVGRDEQLADLVGWLGQPGGVSVRLLHAAGGQGKTRLAQRVTARCVAQGWAVWQVRHTPTSVGSSRADMPTGGSVVAVVDYADRWPVSDLLALLNHLQTLNMRTGITVRVLMLARSGGSWWRALSARLDRDFAIPATARTLPPLGTQVDRAVLYRAARQRFAEAMKVPGAAELPVPHALGATAFAQVLAVHMAALVAVDAHRRGRAAPTAPHALSAYLLRREYDYWHALHDQDGARRQTSPEMMGRAVYVATLTGAVPRAAARTALQRVKVTEPGVDTIIDDHRFCYPPVDARMVLEALHPDRLGEDLIALSTPGHPHSDEDGWQPDDWAATAAHDLLTADRAASTWTPTAVSVLVETAHRWEHIATEVLYPLLTQRPALALAAGGATIARIVDLPDIDPAVLEAIDRVLPPGKHVDLDAAAAAISTTLTRHRLSHTTDPAEQARLYAAHSRRLANAGRREEALAPAEEAVTIRRRLAEADRAAYLPDLADSLTSLSVCLAPGRREEALTAAEEAADLYRGLAEANPAAYLPGLAAALGNVAVDLWELGRQDEGLALAEETVTIQRRLAKANPAVHMPGLANGLTNLSMYLSKLGRPAEALPPAQEAADLYQRLAAANPAAHMPDLATALGALTWCLSVLGRPAKALTAAKKSAKIYRRLAEANPAAHTPGLATALTNLAIILGPGHPEEALTAAEEATELLRELARANPRAYLPDLAAALTNLTNRLSELGSLNDALAPAEESVEISRRLAETNPAAHLPGLVTALINLGGRLLELGRPNEALAPAKESVEISRRLAETNPDAHLPDLAKALGNLAVCLSQLARQAEALALAEEAVTIRRRMAAANPAAHLPGLADSLNDLSVRAADASRLDEATEAVEEAVTIRRRLANADPATHLPDLAASLNDLGGRLAVAGRWDDALAPVEEAADLYRRLASAEPTIYLDNLAASLGNLGECLSRLGRLDEARAIAQEAMTSRRRSDNTAPTPDQADLADLSREAVQDLINLLEVATGRRTSAGPWRSIDLDGQPGESDNDSGQRRRATPSRGRRPWRRGRRGKPR